MIVQWFQCLNNIPGSQLTLSSVTGIKWAFACICMLFQEQISFYCMWIIPFFEYRLILVNIICLYENTILFYCKVLAMHWDGIMWLVRVCCNIENNGVHLYIYKSYNSVGTKFCWHLHFSKCHLINVNVLQGCR